MELTREEEVGGRRVQGGRNDDKVVRDPRRLLDGIHSAESLV